MAKFIHTVPIGVTNSPLGAPGSIIGVSTLSKGDGTPATVADFSNAAMIANGIAFAQIPDILNPQVGAVLGTPFAAGVRTAPFTAVQDVENGMLFPPIAGAIYDGTRWTNPLRADRSLGQVETVSIDVAGTAYTTGTGLSTTFTAAFSGGKGSGLTVDITSVGSNGEITGVSINNAGYNYEVGDKIYVTTNQGNGILEITSLVKPTLGTINTGRVGDEMSPSYFTDLPDGYTAEDLYLVAPATGAVMRYDASLTAPYTHDAFGDVFDGSDFRVEIYSNGNPERLAVFTCPEQEPNVDVDFTGG